MPLVSSLAFQQASVVIVHPVLMTWLIKQANVINVYQAAQAYGKDDNMMRMDDG